MPFLLTVLIIVVLVMGFATAGMKVYVRPKEAMDRVAGGTQSVDQMPSHPSLAMHELIKKLGNIIPQSPKDVTVMQRRLIRAGIRGPNALKLLYGAKVVMGVALPLLTLLSVGGMSADPGNKAFAVLAAAALGFF